MALNDGYYLPCAVCCEDDTTTDLYLIHSGVSDETSQQLWELKLVNGGSVFSLVAIPNRDLKRIGEYLIGMHNASVDPLTMEK